MKKFLLIFWGVLGISFGVGLSRANWFFVGDSESSFFDNDFLGAAESVNAAEEVQFVKYPALSVENSLRYQQMMSRKPGEVAIRVVGDVAPVRFADMQLRKKGMNYAFAAEGIEELLSSADITLVNLETPLVKNCQAKSEGMIFCGLPEFANEMRRVGIDFAGLANNHSGNYGEAGIRETQDILNSVGVQPLVHLRSIYSHVEGMRFGFLALNVVGQQVDREELTKVLEGMKVSADVVIVSVHWGREYVAVPISAPGVANDQPIELGRWLVDHGVDLVVGHHPHVVQGVEVYKRGFIAYSHGNFIFDQDWSKETKQGVVGSYTFYDKKLVDVYFTPVVIEDWVRPRLAGLAEHQEILERMRDSSKEIAVYGE